MKNSFVLYTDYMEHMNLLSMEQRGQLFTVILCYAAEDPLPEVDGIVSMAFSFIKAQMDRDAEKYNEVSQKRKEAGKLGGRPKGKESKENQSKAKKANGFSEKQTKAKKPDTDNDTVNDTDTENDIYNTFCPEAETSAPGSQIVISFLLNDGSMYNVTENDVERFQQLYPGIDCMQEFRNIVGWCENNPKNRKTKSGAKRFINAWMSRAQNRAPVQRPMQLKKNQFHNFDQRDYDFDDLMKQVREAEG